MKYSESALLTASRRPLPFDSTLIFSPSFSIVSDDGKEYYGAGVDHDIIRASIDALESAMNRSLEKAE